jgi:hypothetical protein
MIMLIEWIVSKGTEMINGLVPVYLGPLLISLGVGLLGIFVKPYSRNVR